MSRGNEGATRRAMRGSARGWLSRLGLVAAGVVLGVGITLVGSGHAGKLQPPEDPEVLVALGQLMDTEHRRVDLLLEQGDIAGAIAALEALRAGEWPDRRRGGDASIQLRHDAYGRLVRLRLDHPAVDTVTDDALLAIIDEGLGPEADSLDNNVFTARLVALRGEVLEKLGRDDDALSAYERALDINRALLDDLLNESTP